MGGTYLDEANDHLMPSYGKMKILIESGEGAHVMLRVDNGELRRCLDLLCGLGVNSLGHCHPEVMAAIIRQSQKLMHVSNLYATGPMAHLAHDVANISELPQAKVFFCNSGTEANEAALKLARLWADDHFAARKHRIISLVDSFHGRTLFSISVTGQEKMQERFGPRPGGIEFVELNDIDQLTAAVDNSVCAIIFETIQAEGGVNLMSKEFYHEITRLAHKYDFLRIVDEVQTGIGRTGRMFSFEHFVEKPEDLPDIITVAKALGGGLPIGATIANGDVAKSLVVGSHAATFGGNPVACAAGKAVLDTIIQEDLCEKAASLGQSMLDDLNRIATLHSSKIKEVRGKGLIVGVELKDGYEAATVISEMLKNDILVGSAGKQVVRFIPPLISETDDLARALKIFEEVISQM